MTLPVMPLLESMTGQRLITRRDQRHTVRENDRTPIPRLKPLGGGKPVLELTQDSTILVQEHASEPSADGGERLQNAGFAPSRFGPLHCDQSSAWIERRAKAESEHPADEKWFAWSPLLPHYLSL